MFFNRRITASGSALQHPLAERRNQAGFLGERNELDRRDQAHLRVAPAH
jgi:hypothetical protein